MFYLRGGGNKCTCDLEIIPRHTDREHDISLCFYYLFQGNKDGGREKCLFLLSRPYQKLKFVARRRNKAGERSAIKATFKGWPPACQINTSPNVTYRRYLDLLRTTRIRWKLIVSKRDYVMWFLTGSRLLSRLSVCLK